MIKIKTMKYKKKNNKRNKEKERSKTEKTLYAGASGFLIKDYTDAAGALPAHRSISDLTGVAARIGSSLLYRSGR